MGIDTILHDPSPMHEARHRPARCNPRYLHTVRRVAPPHADMWSIRKIAATCVLVDALLVRPAAAQQSTEDLAAAAQNPIAAMYSLPFQNNTFFGVSVTAYHSLVR